jgi:putative SOS response-associated peptidase YedK
MCSHYLPVPTPEILRASFDVTPPKDLGRHDMWPGYMGLFIRRPEHADLGDEAVPGREAVLGRWGLVPHWSKDGKERNTFNARSETAATKPSFREAWQRSQRCIIPAMGVFEPDWRSGKAVSTQIVSADGQPMGIAGLWSAWKSPDGWLESYTMLTVNADQHELMQNFHKPDEEKRMVVILPQDRYADWLNASPEGAGEFMQTYPAGLLHTMAPASTHNTLF